MARPEQLRFEGTTAPTKRCGRCGVLKHINGFPLDKSRADGRYPYCKVCHRSYQSTWGMRHPERLAERVARATARAKAWQASHPDEYRALLRRRMMLRRHGITPAEYGAMLDDQGGTCALCTTRPSEERHGVLHVDHDHRCCGPDSGCLACVRGLLCFKHNVLLGNASDDRELLRRAISYLDAHDPEAQDQRRRAQDRARALRR